MYCIAILPVQKLPHFLKFPKLANISPVDRVRIVAKIQFGDFGIYGNFCTVKIATQLDIHLTNTITTISRNIIMTKMQSLMMIPFKKNSKLSHFDILFPNALEGTYNVPMDFV